VATGKLTALASNYHPDAFGSHPERGATLASAAALCYAGYLFLLRGAGDDEHVIAPVFEATVAALLATVPVGLIWQGIDPTPSWATLGWLVALALSGQVAGWLLIAAALPRLPATVGASLLLLQPVGSVALGALVLAERPSALQLAGCLVVLVAVHQATRASQRHR
jgi:drug/metabolite transporter (DMT)-like permease